MLRGVNQRTAIAITLMGVLLLSIGTCVIPAQSAAHSCCSHMGMPCPSVNAGCCAASPGTPTAVVTPAFPGLAPIDIAADFLPAGDSSVSRDAMIASILPSQSPPPGIYILRI
jgi:hypothetical protein